MQVPKQEKRFKREAVGRYNEKIRIGPMRAFKKFRAIASLLFYTQYISICATFQIL
jgi:hypothetical protein